MLLCYPNCSTCKKAQAWLESKGLSLEDEEIAAALLDAHGVAVETRDIKLEKPTEEELRRWYAMSGLPLKRFFNTSGLSYKSLQLKDKLPKMSEGQQFALLSTDGMLVKRPLLIGDGFVLVGFREGDWEAALT